MKRFLKIILIFIAVLSVILSILTMIVYRRLVPYKNMEVDSRIINVQMKGGGASLYAFEFYDRENRRGKEYLLDSFAVESKESFISVELDEVPRDLVNAFIAIEDKRFYKHNGVDFLRTARAGINYVLKKSSSFGGSTITQQLVKNLTGDSEKSVERKIREIFYAINLEREYTKDEILGMYLNVINLGCGCRGVGAAADTYFSKSVSELSLSECATIAAITNNPSYYNPVTNIDNTHRRRDLILSCMLEENFITKEEYDKALSEDIILFYKKKNAGKVNSWYTDMVIEDVTRDLMKRYDIDRGAASNIIYNGNIRIYTAMDEKIQLLLEEYYKNLVMSGGRLVNAPGIRSSFIAIDAKTGDILGVVGDVGEKKGNRLQNFAIDTKRPSGSAIKPLSVYAPALEKGIISWSSIYSDSPVEEKDGRAWPLNANGKYIGDVDIEYAIANSLNTVSVRVLRELGADKSFEFLKNNLNFSSLVDESVNDIGDVCDSSLALGQHKNGVTLSELCAGYTIFSDGVYKKPRSYFKVTDCDGNILLENDAVSAKVIGKESAAIMTKLLQGVVKNGTAKNRISLEEKIEIAGKTGTTSNNCDRYFVGYTPDIVGACWLGYEYPKKIELYGNPCVSIWDDVFSKIYLLDGYKYAKSSFKIPDTVAKYSYDKKSGQTPDLYSLEENIKEGWFVK